MNKKNFIIFIAIIIAFFVLFEFNTSTNNISQVCFQETCFNVEIADTQEERAAGLMNRESLAEDSGMLFIFEEEGTYAFWMKNTKILLDIIWMDENKRVVFIKENAAPCVTEICENIVPDKEAKYVLELNYGKVNEIGIKVGEYLEFK